MINLTIKKEHREDCKKAQDHLDGGQPLQNKAYSNWTWFHLLYACFVNGVDKEEIASWYECRGADRSFILRVLSHKTGVDTSRLVVIRNNFKNYYKKWYKKDPFIEYRVKDQDRENRRHEGGFGI